MEQIGGFDQSHEGQPVHDWGGLERGQRAECWLVMYIGSYSQAQQVLA